MLKYMYVWYVCHLLLGRKHFRLNEEMTCRRDAMFYSYRIELLTQVVFPFLILLTRAGGERKGKKPSSPNKNH